MLDSLSLLVITFMVMSVISVAGVVLMYVLRNEKAKKGILYFLAVWGVVIAYCGVQSIRLLVTASPLVPLTLGALGVIAALVQMFMKSEKRFTVARVLVTVSVVAGMINCFMI